MIKIYVNYWHETELERNLDVFPVLLYCCPNQKPLQMWKKQAFLKCILIPKSLQYTGLAKEWDILLTLRGLIRESFKIKFTISHFSLWPRICFQPAALTRFPHVD